MENVTNGILIVNLVIVIILFIVVSERLQKLEYDLAWESQINPCEQPASIILPQQLHQN